MVPADHQLTSMSLQITDNTGVSDAVLRAVDLTVRGVWQRVSVTFIAAGEAGRQISMKFIGAAAEPLTTPIMTQCWQIEEGSTATSYIPSEGQVGIREADDLVVLDTSPHTNIDSYGLREAITRVIPAGSIAWMTVIG